MTQVRTHIEKAEEHSDKAAHHASEAGGYLGGNGEGAVNLDEAKLEALLSIGQRLAAIDERLAAQTVKP